MLEVIVLVFRQWSQRTVAPLGLTHVEHYRSPVYKSNSPALRVIEMVQANDSRTTITVGRRTLDRFHDAKPYETMNADEFVDVLLDRWEGRR